MSQPTKGEVEINISNRTLLRAVVIICLSLIAIKFLSLAAHVLSLVAISFFLAVALNPAISWIIRRLSIKSRVKAAALAYVALLSVLFTVIIITVPPLIKQTSNFVDQLPTTVHNLSTQDNFFARFTREHQLNGQLDDIVDNLHEHITNLGVPALNTAANIGSTAVSIITVLVMTFMMLVEGPYWVRRFWELYPAKHKAPHKQTSMRMYDIVTGYVNGQLIIAAIAAGFALIALLIASSLFNVSINAVGLAGVVGIIGLIPMIGNIIAAVIVVLVCLFSSVPLALTMAIFFVIYQQVENATIQPYVQSKFNELTPLLVFIAALLGIGFGGLLGAFVAIPLAGCLKIIYNEYMHEHRNK